MVTCFSGKNANDVWINAYRRLTNKGTTQASRNGQTSEILHCCLSIETPRQRWLSQRFPPINPGFAIAESFWILQGRQDSQFINSWNSQLPKYAGDYKSYPGAYGHRLTYNFGLNQIERAYLTLKNNPNSRQVVLQIWDPQKDYPKPDGTPRNKDIPCNICSLLKIRNNKLEWFQTIRSNDIFLGVPYNIIQFTTIQEILAGWLGVDIGSYNQLSDSLHLYNHDKKRGIDISPCSVTTNTDILTTTKKEFNIFFPQLMNILEDSVTATSWTHDLNKRVADLNIPPSYRNLLAIALAEIFRRKRWSDETAFALTQCHNKLFTELFYNWTNYLKNKGTHNEKNECIH